MDYHHVVRIEEYLQSLPHSIISGEDVELDEETLRHIFQFASLTKNDVFYHLGCNSEKGITTALEEFHVKKAVGIDSNKEKINKAQAVLNEKNLVDGHLRCEDVLNSDIDDATVVLFWFTDENINEKMVTKFSSLKLGCRIITIWGPLSGCLPDKVDFPYILNIVPFQRAKDLKEQMIAMFETDCIDFTIAWEFAERYCRAISSKDSESDRFLTILLTLVIWINARNLGIACGKDVPEPVKSYIGILKTYFNIEIEHLLDNKTT